MARSAWLRLERLEARDVPALFGVPWADHNISISISFVPDGTAVNGQPSSLNQVFQRAGLTTQQGDAEILRGRG